MEEKVVLITGSSRGIGFHLAQEFLDDENKVVVFCRHQDHIDQAVAQLEGEESKILPLVGDVRKKEDVNRIVTETMKEFSRIDVLVNNAGKAVYKPIEDTSTNEWDDVMDTNARGSFMFCKKVLPIMKEQGSGVIINVSSGLGLRGQANYSAYSMSKFALIGLTEVLAEETRNYSDIKIYAVCPGGVNTKLHRDIHPQEDPEGMMEPEYVASKIFDLNSGEERSGAKVKIYS